MKKGSSKTITKLLKNHPFTKNNLAKYRNLTWKSTKPKVIEVKANRKLIAKKKGKAYLRGIISVNIGDGLAQLGGNAFLHGSLVVCQ